MLHTVSRIVRGVGDTRLMRGTLSPAGMPAKPYLMLATEEDMV
jgi:hypothetical protein